jgi:hypothetical protein
MSEADSSFNNFWLFEGVIAYIVDRNDVDVVADVWNRFCKNSKELAIAVVDELPRGARVEWHVIRCRNRQMKGETLNSEWSSIQNRMSMSIKGKEAFCI